MPGLLSSPGVGGQWGDCNLCENVASDVASAARKQVFSEPKPPAPSTLCAVVHSIQHLKATRHPRHPNRSVLCHALLRSLGMLGRPGAPAKVLVPEPCSERGLLEHHSSSYVAALRCEQSGDGACGVDSDDSLVAESRRKRRRTQKSSENACPATKTLSEQLGSTSDVASLLQLPSPPTFEPSEAHKEHGIEDDCPPFEGMFQYCLSVAGGTITAVDALRGGICKRVCHFEGGRHHARKDCAAGLCYVADVVLGVIRLHQNFPKVMIIDIDVHHGDGTEEAFYNSAREMCMSLHMHGHGIFPGTGEENSTGMFMGKSCTVNLPLRPGCRDAQYRKCFRSVAESARRHYCPDAVVLLVGADALYGDELGQLRLSQECLLKCVAQVRDWDLPTLVLGSGGYCDAITSRYWAHIVALMSDDGTRWPRRVEPDPIPHYGQCQGADYPSGLSERLFDTAEVPPDIGEDAFDVLCGGSGSERYCGLAVREPPAPVKNDPNTDEYIDYLIFNSIGNILKYKNK